MRFQFSDKDAERRAVAGRVRSGTYLSGKRVYRDLGFFCLIQGVDYVKPTAWTSHEGGTSPERTNEMCTDSIDGTDRPVGWHHSEGSRRKMSEAKKGKRRRRAPAVTLQSRLKMSESQKRKWRDPEHREKITRAIREGTANKKKQREAAASEVSTSPEPQRDVT